MIVNHFNTLPSRAFTGHNDSQTCRLKFQSCQFSFLMFDTSAFLTIICKKFVKPCHLKYLILLIFFFFSYYPLKKLLILIWTVTFDKWITVFLSYSRPCAQYKSAFKLWLYYLWNLLYMMQNFWMQYNLFEH